MGATVKVNVEIPVSKLTYGQRDDVSRYNTSTKVELQDDGRFSLGEYTFERTDLLEAMEILNKYKRIETANAD